MLQLYNNNSNSNNNTVSLQLFIVAFKLISYLILLVQTTDRYPTGKYVNVGCRQQNTTGDWLSTYLL